MRAKVFSDRDLLAGLPTAAQLEHVREVQEERFRPVVGDTLWRTDGDLPSYGTSTIWIICELGWHADEGVDPVRALNRGTVKYLTTVMRLT